MMQGRGEKETTMQLEADIIRNSLIILNISTFIWEFYLITRQLLTVLRTKIPQPYREELDPVTVEKSRKCEQRKLKLRMIENLQRILIIVWILHNEILMYFWQYLLSYNSSPLKVNIVAGFIFIAAPWLICIPFRIYELLSAEKEKHNIRFNILSILVVIWKSIMRVFKTCMFVIIISSISLLFIMIGFYGKFDYTNTIILNFLVMFIPICMERIYPSLIEPILYKYTPLSDGDLKAQIEDLCLKCDLESLPVEVRHTSSESLTNVASVINNKIILDNVLLTFDNDIVVAIVARELSHLKLQHEKKDKNINTFSSIALMGIFYYLLDWYPVYRALGFVQVKPKIVAMFILYQFFGKPLVMFYWYFTNRMLREREITADNFAIQKQKGEGLRSAVLEIWTRNLHFPISDKLYRDWVNYNVLLIDRLNNIDMKINRLP